MKNIKKVVALIFSMLLCMNLLAGCRGEENRDITAQFSASEILAFVFAERPIEGSVSCFIGRKGDEDNSVLGFYGLDDEAIEKVDDYAILKPTTAIADEYIVIRTSSVDEIGSIVEEYRKERINDFGGYAPLEEQKIEKSEVLACKNIVALLIGNDENEYRQLFDDIINRQSEGYKKTSEEEKAYNEIFELAFVDGVENDNDKWNNPDNFPEGPRPGTKIDVDGTILCMQDSEDENVYDSSHIVEAYKKNDESLLHNKRDILVLNKAREIIEERINDEMDCYTKEKTIHDYIVNHTAYDKRAHIYSNWYSEYSDQPYGCLILGQSVCYGYATTFKMFMDMLDIECMVVDGTSYEDGIHGWNLVKLDDDKWYAVDVTWDDPSYTEECSHDYFNVDDSVMRESHHDWSHKDYPKATGGQYSYN